jgi:hypothetical protein
MVSMMLGIVVLGVGRDVCGTAGNGAVGNVQRDILPATTLYPRTALGMGFWQTMSGVRYGARAAQTAHHDAGMHKSTNRLEQH